MLLFAIVLSIPHLFQEFPTSFLSEKSFLVVLVATLYLDSLLRVIFQSKIVMYSQFERQKDPRNWGQRQTVFTGPHVLYAAERIQPCRIVKFNPDTGLPEYEDIPGAERPAGEEEEEE